MANRAMKSMIFPFVAFAVFWTFPLAHTATEVKDVAASSQEVSAAPPKFICAGKAPGYYADVHSGCQRYHMCDSGGRLYSYTCPNQTLFQQRVMICDHWFMVDCSLSVNYYSSNQNIGIKGRPFIAGYEEASRRPSSRRVTGTTPYPWQRNTSFTPGEPIRKQQQFHQTPVKKTTEKPLKLPVIKSENKVVTKNDNVGNFAPSSEVRREWTLPKEYAHNPFFSGLTRPSTEAPNIILEKGHAEVLTSPRAKVHSNVFDKNSNSNNIYLTSTSTTFVTNSFASVTPPTVSTSLSEDHKFNRFSTPSQELRNTLPNVQESNAPVFADESPLTSGTNFVTPRGHFILYQDELQNSFPSDEDLNETPPSTVQYEQIPEEEISSNTVELRIPDTRHMFYIADTPIREAEMLKTVNETVLTIALPSEKHHHGKMKFKGSRNPKGRREECPQCHPAFLLPGRCQPCVLIRR